jgi:hypothetical protein
MEYCQCSTIVTILHYPHYVTEIQLPILIKNR